MKKLAALALVLLAAASGIVQAEPLPTDKALADRIVGDPDAPITIIEYASLTCPHCAKFHVYTLPELKTNWLDTGRAKLIFRDLPTRPVNLSFSLAMVARCAPEDRYFEILGALFENQRDWLRFENGLKAFERALEHAGVSKDEAKACLDDEGLYNGMLKRADEARTQYGVDRTPSFVIAGKTYTGAAEYTQLDEILRGATPQ